jgi:hypothetical protein
VLQAFSNINWLAVAIASVVSIGLGGLWFGLVAAKQYVRVLGREGQPAPQQRTVDAVGPLVCIVVVVLTSAVLVAALQLSTVTDAVVFGLVVGIGYLLAMTFQIAINPNFPHPLRYGALNAPYFLTTSLVTSLALVLI